MRYGAPWWAIGVGEIARDCCTVSWMGFGDRIRIGLVCRRELWVVGGVVGLIPRIARRTSRRTAMHHVTRHMPQVKVHEIYGVGPWFLKNMT